MSEFSAILNAFTREHAIVAVAICAVLIVIAAVWAGWLRRDLEQADAGDTQSMLGAMRTADAARMARETDALLNGHRAYAWPWIAKAHGAKAIAPNAKAPQQADAPTPRPRVRASTPPPLKPSYDGAKDTRTRTAPAASRKRTPAPPGSKH